MARRPRAPPQGVWAYRPRFDVVVEQRERNVSALRRFRAWADLGRAQGITSTATIAIVGAITSTTSLASAGASTPLEAFLRLFILDPHRIDAFDLAILTLVSVFTHAVPNAYIELGDYPLDSLIKESSRKPIVSGIIQPRQVWWFILVGLSISVALSLVAFFRYPGDPRLPNLPMLAALTGGALWVMWYGNGAGKRLVGSYDFAFTVAYCFYALYGAFAVGLPTIWTVAFLGVVATAGTTFTQWENGLKDVRADRVTGVRSLAVVSGLTEDGPLPWRHPFLLYGIALKVAFLSVPLWVLTLMDPALRLPYAIFLALVALPSQVWVLWRFHRYRDRLSIRKTMLWDVTFAATIAFSILIPIVGWWGLLGLMAFLVGGYLIGSSAQYGTEFKFGRYSSRWEERLSTDQLVE